MKKSVRNAYIISTVISLVIIACLLWYFLSDPNRSPYKTNITYVSVYVPTAELHVGDVLSNSNTRRVDLDADTIPHKDGLLVESDLDGARVLTSLHINEPIYTKDVIRPAVDYSSLSPLAVAVDNPFSTSAYSINIGDYVDINVTLGRLGEGRLTDYPDVEEASSFRRVISKVRVDDLRTADGISLKDNPGLVPAYAIFYLTDDQINNYLNAYSVGTFFLGQYTDPTSPPREENYLWVD